MAQPQGLNLPAIATTGIVTVILTGVIVEGVRALYAYELPREEARKWESVQQSTPHRLRDEQEMNLTSYKTSVPIEEAMKKVAASGGHRPATQPTTRSAASNEGMDKATVVQGLIKDSQKLTQTGRYAEAVKVIDQIAAIDPANEYAVTLRPIVFDRSEAAKARAEGRTYTSQLNGRVTSDWR